MAYRKEKSEARLDGSHDCTLMFVGFEIAGSKMLGLRLQGQQSGIDVTLSINSQVIGFGPDVAQCTILTEVSDEACLPACHALARRVLTAISTGMKSTMNFSLPGTTCNAPNATASTRPAMYVLL